MKFSTKVEIPHSSIEFDYQDKVITVGSCFSDNIGLSLKNAYFDTLTNPFGVLYNPFSVLRGLDLLLNNEKLSIADLFLHNGLWSSFLYSSHYSETERLVAFERMQGQLERGRDFLFQAKMLFITFGTAWVYRDREQGVVVANCHKLPSNRFERHRLSVEEIVNAYADLLHRLKNTCPQLNVVFTVSPIRHWKDGVYENTLSKSILHLSISALLNRFDFVSYFPAYEIVMDELRDYRYYATDMLHPSTVSIDYIWQRFSETFFSQKTQLLQKQLEQYRRDVSHRPLHRDTNQFNTFSLSVQKKKNLLLEQYPYLENRL